MPSPPRRILPSRWPLALYGRASSRAIEAAALADAPPQSLMAKAGTAVARLALACQPHARRIWVACGPGNNGGDGLVAARWLQAQGKQVWVSRLAGRSPASADTAWALTQARSSGLTIHDTGPAEAVDLVIDGLLGLGAEQAPSLEIAAQIAAINRQFAPVLAIDLPSGLCAETGRLLGEEAVRADRTLALLTLKTGLVTGEGRAHAGELWLDPLDVQDTAVRRQADAWLSSDHLLAQWRSTSAGAAGRIAHSMHKGLRGDVLLIGGASGMAGANRLAARAALAAGAGRVYLCALAADANPDPTRPELMDWPADRLADSASWHDKTVVAGCGGGHAIAERLPSLLAQARRLVLDADGLNQLAASPALAQGLARRRAQGLLTVITPHPLEAARLLGCSSRTVQADRLAAAATLSARLDCVVVLKGSGTVVAAPGHTPMVNSSGGPALATAGSGDVLAGWLGGLWTQLAPPQPAQDRDVAALAAAWRAACTVVYWHGRAAEAQIAGPLRAAELVEAMHRLHPI